MSVRKSICVDGHFLQFKFFGVVSNLDAQNMTLDKEDLYIGEQIEECALQLYKEAEKKNLDVEIDIGHFRCNASKTLLK